MNKNARKTKNKDQRGEYRRLKRENTRTDNLQCFKCRQFGHILKNCLSLSNDDGENLKFVEEENFDICYKCGSLEHKSLHCISFTSGGAEEYPFAKCFVCGKMGHIAKSCSSNDKGIYPNGGCCLYCRSVRHMKKDCPQINRNIKYNIHNDISSSVNIVNDVKKLKKKKKVIKF